LTNRDYTDYNHFYQ